MRGAAVWFTCERAEWLDDGRGGRPDVIMTNDMLNTADLRALLPPVARGIPIVCYFHENQLTYPIPDEQERDYQYGMTNTVSCLAADAVWFNSRFHMEDFLAAAGGLLRKMPDHVPDGIVEKIRRKSLVLPPPVDVRPLQRTHAAGRSRPTILWCHRWEYDKNPAPFFEALVRLGDSGCDFEINLTGEQFRDAPAVFATLLGRLKEHVAHAGYIVGRADYLAMLARSDYVVSTAIQENFGIAVIEAILAGCHPILPNRLVYPEIIPARYHDRCLYRDDAALFGHLQRLLADRDERLTPEELIELQSSLSERFGHETAVPALDAELSRVVRTTRTGVGQ